jgi:hypothetical protein
MSAKNPLINYLTAQQASAYIAVVKDNDNLFRLIRESFKLKFDSRKGITKDEMNQLIDGTTDPDLKNVLKDVKLLGDSGALLTLDSATRNEFRKALIVYGKRNDGKYDILVVYATQTKEIAMDKLLACGLGSICAGILAGCATLNPAVGFGTAVVLSAASGTKAAYDYSQDVPDVLCGYILQELVQKQLVNVLSNGKVELAVN